MDRTEAVVKKFSFGQRFDKGYGNRADITKVSAVCRNIRIFFLIAIFLSIFYSQKCQQGCRASEQKEAGSPISVVVDPRIELMAIIFHLAGNSEYNESMVLSYSKDVDEYFARFRDHKAVEFARYLREKKLIAYNAPMSLAIYVDNSFNLREIFSTTEHRPDGLDERWTPGDVSEFLKEVQNFAKETDYANFMKQHKKFYDIAGERMEKALKEGNIVNWLSTFFTIDSQRRYIITPAMLDGINSYGARARNSDGAIEFYSILGVCWKVDTDGLPEFHPAISLTVVHESCHSFVNPLVDANALELKRAGEQIFPFVEKKMKKQAYDRWEILMYESIVRACTIRYILSYSGSEDARDTIVKEQNRGFIWMEELSDLLGEYEASREKYKTFDSFFPRVTLFFNDYARLIKEKVEAREERLENEWKAFSLKAPKIIRTVPQIGSQDVDPNLNCIEITFNHPMMDKKWGLTAEGENHPDIVGNLSYDSTRMVFKIPVKLKPSLSYEFILNSRERAGEKMLFMDENGNPLMPFKFYFKTRVQ